MKKIKVALICHFSNKFVRSKLRLTNYKIDNYFRKLLGSPQNQYGDFAKWITNIIDEFKYYEDIELHVISCHSGMLNITSEFESEGVKYHFYRSVPLFPFYYLEKLFYKKQYTDYPRTRKIVKSFIKEINPDIVNLIGAETPIVGINGLDIVQQPLFILCQTVYSNPQREKLSGAKPDQLRWNIETKLFNKVNYFACTGRMYYDLIKEKNPNSYIFPLTFPSGSFPVLKVVPKDYDFVFFAAKVEEKKGIYNAIEAMGQVCEKYPQTTLLIVGMCAPDMKNKIIKRATDLGIRDNILFHSFFEKHEEMLQYVFRARYALLPIKLDVISGTIIESMRMGMPVVTFKTSGTPFLNKEKQSVLIADLNDDKGLACNMLKLIEDPKLATTLVNNSKDWLLKYKNDAVNTRRIANQYHLIIDHFYNKRPIPKNELFNPTDYPEYK